MISLGWLWNKRLSSFIRHILRGNTEAVSACSVNKSCSTLWDLMDGSSPGSSVHKNLQARILEWVAAVFSKQPYRPKDWNCFSFRQILYHWATWEAKKSSRYCKRFLDGTSLVIQWLRLHAANAGGTALITAQGNSRAWKPTPVFLPGESHGQRSQAGYGPWDHRVGQDWSDLAHTG